MKHNLGTSTYLKRTGISAPTMRTLEVLGVISPAKSDSGWRMFSEDDVQATLAWKKGGSRRRQLTATSAK